jgi:nicotinamide N-methyltransferase
LIKDKIIVVKNKSVLELGSGSGLASLQCIISGANSVVMNDYPDKEITENLNYNIIQNLPMFSQS